MAWGIQIERVGVKAIALPESARRSLSRQAEAERERPARIIAADGEYQTAAKPTQPAATMAADPPLVTFLGSATTDGGVG